MGTNTAAMQPKSVPDQLTPSAANIYCEKSGKPAPASDRKNVFAAIAEAALEILLKHFRYQKAIKNLQHEVGVDEVIKSL